MKNLLKALCALNQAKQANRTFGEILPLECEVATLANLVRLHAMKHAYQILGMERAQ